MWCADVLAYSDGNPKALFEPYTTQDPCYGDPNCEAGNTYFVGHDHIDEYVDENGNCEPS